MARVIAITGASSGLGRALALEYGAPGVALALIGRDAARLEATAAEVRAKGAEVRLGVIDVRDCAAMSAFLLEMNSATPIDCLIASAAVSMVTPAAGAVEDLTQVGSTLRRQSERRDEHPRADRAADAPAPSRADRAVRLDRRVRTAPDRLLRRQQGRHPRVWTSDARALPRGWRFGECRLSGVCRHADDQFVR